LKKKYKISAFLSIVLIATLLIFEHQLNNGVFIKWSHTWMSHDNTDFFEKKKPVYLGYAFDWEGIGEPILKDITLIKKDGTTFKDNPQISITPYLSNRSLGSIFVEDAIKEGYLDSFLPVKDYKVTNDSFYLVLKIEIKNKGYRNNIDKLQIDYELWNFSKKQYIDFKGVVSEEDENE
jgi:hypothetical protein